MWSPFVLNGVFPGALPAAPTSQHALKDQHLRADLHLAIEDEERWHIASQSRSTSCRKGTGRCLTREKGLKRRWHLPLTIIFKLSEENREIDKLIIFQVLKPKVSMRCCISTHSCPKFALPKAPRPSTFSGASDFPSSTLQTASLALPASRPWAGSPRGPIPGRVHRPRARQGCSGERWSLGSSRAPGWALSLPCWRQSLSELPRETQL